MSNVHTKFKIADTIFERKNEKLFSKAGLPDNER